MIRPGQVFKDPTMGVFASAYTGNFEDATSLFVKTEFVFYDDKGQPINFDQALMSVASLNREANSIEMAKDYTGTFNKISGSSVGEKNGQIYATESENFKKDVGGSRFTMYKNSQAGTLQMLRIHGMEQERQKFLARPTV